MRLPAVALLVLLAAVTFAGCSSSPAPGASSSSSTSAASPSSFPRFTVPTDRSCPGHWHDTFAVYTPAGDGSPHRLDLSVPRLQSGRSYYDLGVAANMTVAAHLHQSGPETGAAALGPYQMHHEANGRCTGIAAALRSVDVDAGNGTLVVRGANRFSGQAGEWHATAESPLRVLIETKAAGNWTWQEADPQEAFAYQPRDGESWLVAIGPFTDAQLRAAADALPDPSSRVTESPHPLPGA